MNALEKAFENARVCIVEEKDQKRVIARLGELGKETQVERVRYRGKVTSVVIVHKSPRDEVIIGESVISVSRYTIAMIQVRKLYGSTGSTEFEGKEIEVIYANSDFYLEEVQERYRPRLTNGAGVNFIV